MLFFKHRFREESRSLRSWSVALGLTTVGVTIAAISLGSLRENIELFTKALTRLPAVMKMIGGSLALLNPATLVVGTILNTVAPIFLLVYTTLAALGIYTREASQGSLEFLFSLPIERRGLAFGRFFVFLSDLALLHLVLFAALAAGLALGGEEVNPAALALINLNLFALFACLGGLSFLLSLACSDYTRGMLIILPIQLGFFLLNTLLDEGRGILRLVNPYSLYAGANVLGGVRPWGGILALFLGAAVFWLGGIWLFARKQVA